jgi:TetR/AcrR family transcriptional repressor of nem operon
MPYAADHKARTRSRIVDAARGLFNRHGFEQVSIDQIMEAADLTRGGFYHHFSSKADLYAETIASFATCNPLAIRQAAAKRPVQDPAKLARLLLDLYLSDEVLNDPDKHCPLYALPSDVARAGLKPQEAYTDIIRGMTHVFGSALGGGKAAERKAQVIVSLCVGGMVLARTTQDEELKRSLRRETRRQALELLEGEGAVN